MSGNRSIINIAAPGGDYVTGGVIADLVPSPGGELPAPVSS